MQIKTLQSYMNAREGNLVDRSFLKVADKASVVAAAVDFGETRLDRAVRGIGEKRLAVLAAHNIKDVMGFVSAGPAAIAGAFASVGDSATRRSETAIVLNLHASMCAAFGKHLSPRAPVATVGFAGVRDVVKDAKAQQYGAMLAPDARFSADSVAVLKGVGRSIEKLLVDAKIKTVTDLANASSNQIYDALRAFEPGGTPAEAAGLIVDLSVALRAAATSYVQPKRPAVVTVQQVSASALARGVVSVRAGKIEIADDRADANRASSLRYSFDGKPVGDKHAKAGGRRFTLDVPKGVRTVEIMLDNGRAGDGERFVLRVL